MAFTTWTALYNAMLDKLASGDTTVGSVMAGDKSVTFRTHKEFLIMLDFVESKAKAESGDFVPRTYAKQGGRGV
ncbi:MAG TPA: hypothetical protein DDY86_02575 [Syntrophaceae bacterium]|nr:hypothetical protein [Syntrophaceae bacterium]